jgi:hypothetical protein
MRGVVMQRGPFKIILDPAAPLTLTLSHPRRAGGEGKKMDVDWS